MSVFCARLNWPTLAVLIAHFSERINFGVHSELLPLLQIPHVKAFRARALYDSGLRSVEDVADASLNTIKEAISRYSKYKKYQTKVQREILLRKQVELKTAKLVKQSAKEVLKAALEKLEKDIGGVSELEKLSGQLFNRKNRFFDRDEEMDAVLGISID